ncbi:MAG: hypothetical protein NTV29_12030 [Planctomycetota bacterium]|nr:hypothetical protein [Planctomycetota bacterium]
MRRITKRFSAAQQIQTQQIQTHGFDTVCVSSGIFRVCNAVLVLSETVLVLVIESGLKKSCFSSAHDLSLHATKLFLLYEYEYEHEHEHEL